MPSVRVNCDQPGSLQPLQCSCGPCKILLVCNCRFRHPHSRPDAKYEGPGSTLDVVYPAAGFDSEVSRADSLYVGLDSVDVCPRIGVSKESPPSVRIS